jgi:hypothetical protein
VSKDQKIAREWREEYLKRPGVIEMIKARAKKYYLREDVIAKRSTQEYKNKCKDYAIKRRLNNPAHKFIDSLRNRQKQVLKGITSTTNGLGCSKEQLSVYLSTQFDDGMSFNNYGNKIGCWSIDHIIPLSSYEKDESGNWDVNSEYNKKLVHYTNLRPMWHIENIKKSNIIA